MASSLIRPLRLTSRCCKLALPRPSQRCVQSLHVTPVRGFASPSMIRRAQVPSPSEAPKVPAFTQSQLSTEEYENISNETMDLLHENLEIYVEEFGPEGPGAWEVEYSSGVMTLSLASRGTYVINKQPPNQQIWMSSPISGPSRFSYSKEPQPSGTWYHHRTFLTLGDILDRELKATLADEGAGEGWEGTGLL